MKQKNNSKFKSFVKKHILLDIIIVLVIIELIFEIISVYSYRKNNDKAKINYFIRSIEEMSRQAATQTVVDSIYGGSLSATYDSNGDNKLDYDAYDNIYRIVVEDGKVTKVFIKDKKYCWAAIGNDLISIENGSLTNKNPIRVADIEDNKSEYFCNGKPVKY